MVTLDATCLEFTPVPFALLSSTVTSYRRVPIPAAHLVLPQLLQRVYAPEVRPAEPRVQHQGGVAVAQRHARVAHPGAAQQRLCENNHDDAGFVYWPV